MNDEIIEWLREYDLYFDEDKYHIHDGIIDIDGDVRINTACEPLPYKFGNVGGTFDIEYCNITSLENCPKYVGALFDCDYTNIKSLKHIPKVISGNIYFQRCENLEDISDLWNVTFLNDRLHLRKTIDSPKVVAEYSEWLRYISTIKMVHYF